MAYQSLYRRYRPQRFADVRGQDHATRALRNSVRDGRVAHAYLFSGPRGTGKTSTARILAKALNCAAPQDGEPCGTCDSCVQIAAGASLDVHELDAASNNGVEAMRELVARTALGTPGRWKVYIVDEVHMLSAAASNALLKTLEEPPGHVVFVLATTDPQKVLSTIRSRTQHFEFRLLPADVARASALIAAFFPMSFVFSMTYPEGLVLAALTLALVFALDGRWTLSAVAGAAAALGRPEALFFALPLAAVAVSRSRVSGRRANGRAIGAAFAPLASVAAFPLYLGWALHNVSAWSGAQQAWGRSFELGGVVDAFHQLFERGQTPWL